MYQVPELTGEQIQASRGALTQLYAQWPDAVRGQLVEHHLTSWRTGLQEAKNLEDEVYEELRSGGWLPDVSMIVLTAMGQNPYWAQFLSEELMREAHNGVRGPTRRSLNLFHGVSSVWSRMLRTNTSPWSILTQCSRQSATCSRKM